ncbi:hypothetical protein [Tessaracoccus massiliensis]|uniref:hypothetical protein n=1 Tax=Tessaracoccus massiliensis TaxID=1522311 RepID=UPI0015D5990D|nr:hypothetical protein [Tessaracoccus massiliensis]
MTDEPIPSGGEELYEEGAAHPGDAAEPTGDELNETVERSVDDLIGGDDNTDAEPKGE